MTQKQGIWGWNNDKHYNYSFDKHWKWLQQAWTPHKSYVFTVLQINLNLLQHIAIIMAHLSVFLWLRNDVNLMFLCFYHVSRILFLRFACLIKRKSTKLWLKCTCLVSTLIHVSLSLTCQKKNYIPNWQSVPVFCFLIDWEHEVVHASGSVWASPCPTQPSL